VALEGCVLVCATIIANELHPLQALPWGLGDPVPEVTPGDGVMKDNTGEGL
jgi:hypothetical protein